MQPLNLISLYQSSSQKVADQISNLFQGKEVDHHVSPYIRILIFFGPDDDQVFAGDILHESANRKTSE
jgi:hypothetical protein